MKSAINQSVRMTNSDRQLMAYMSGSKVGPADERDDEEVTEIMSQRELCHGPVDEASANMPHRFVT